jgi:ABC-type sugar transport system substrate-binding protein
MRVIVIIFLLCLPLNVSAINVVLINPSVPGTPFWDRVTVAAKRAAQSLDINLTVIYGKDNRIYNYNTLLALVEKKSAPDYVIFSPFDGTAKSSFALLNKAKISFITLERTIHADEQALIGLPQEKYNYWLGEIFHDNVQVGRLLTTTLIGLADDKRLKRNNKLSAIGISGSFSGESADRTKGLTEASKDAGNTEILQIVSAGWSREKTRSIFFQFNERYNNIDIVWAASDGMALGVMDAILSGHSKITRDSVVIGGVDWTPEAIRMIEQKQIDASVGGHFMQAAWALVKIYDHHHGVDVFKKSADNYSYDLEVITSKNVEQYMPISKHIDWSTVDFKRFSLFNNPGIKDYDFSFKRIIEQIE